jgi:hypothetical protein
VPSHFPKLFNHFQDRYSAQSFANFLSHLLNCSVIFVWSGTSSSVGVPHGSISSACGTEPRGATRGCWVGRGSLGQSVQVMDLWSMTWARRSNNRPSQATAHARVQPSCTAQDTHELRATSHLHASPTKP